jgi:GGDEF domain-containing protein
MAVLFWLNSTLLSFRAKGRSRIMAPWQSMFDEETGIYNRSYFMETLELELARARESGAPVGVYLVQVARLEPKGDATRLTAEDADAVIACVNGMLGRDDLLATLRPDEFAALVLDGDESISADVLASGLRDALEPSRPSEAYRVRIGHAEMADTRRDGRSIIDAARADMRASRVVLIGAA